MRTELETPTVARTVGDEKLAVPADALDQSGFYLHIERGCALSGMPREEFKVAIKPDFIVFPTRNDASAYTDSEMVDVWQKTVIGHFWTHHHSFGTGWRGT